MKKILFFAATAMLFAACANEEVVAPQTAEVAANAISFDTYTASATRAGDPEGVMTTDKLKTAGKGFGVFAMYQDGVDYPNPNTSLAPNFMFNEQVHFAGAWTYSPLKYWPNETLNDSQTNNGSAVMPDVPAPGTYLDKLSFFAYAPYVSTGDGGTLASKSDDYLPQDATPANNVDAWTGSQTSGISAISRETVVGDPLVEWKFSDNIDKNVDLLWGVAPAGNLTYQAVNGTTINKAFGMPLLDLVKPDKDQKIKFLFNHALSRIGLTVVSAIDQIAAGDAGGKYNSNQTRVLIDEVKVWGDFGIQGTLNLNNTTPNTARWIDETIVNSTSSEASPMYTFSVANGKINPDLRYEDIATVTGAANATDATNAFLALHPGVTASEKLLLSSGPENGIPVTALTYELGKKLYKENSTTHDYELATTTATEDVDVYTKDASDNYTLVKAQGAGSDYIIMSGETPEYWKLTLSAEKTASVNNIAVDADYWVRTGTGAAGSPYVYTKYKNTTGSPIADATTYYEITDPQTLAANAYTGSCYAKLAPRYFMVIPSKTPADASVVNTFNVKITYHVITNDGKLTGYVSDIANTVTKTETIKLLSGKSYNLKLILGLTSVKLDAEVADWQVDGSNEVWLPKNNE